MNDTLVFTEKEKDNDCMTTFFIRVGERKYTSPPSVFMDGVTDSLNREPVQSSRASPVEHATIVNTYTACTYNLNQRRGAVGEED